MPSDKKHNKKHQGGIFMNSKKDYNYCSTKRIKSVSRVPTLYLKLIGKMDSFKGEGVAMAHVEKMLDRCTEFETMECLTAESNLFDERKKGAYLLAEIDSCTLKLSNLPEKSKGTTTYEIRNNLRLEREKENAISSINAAKKELFVINENIINGDAILHERVIKTRKLAAEKIDAYIKGLRSGKLKQFEKDLCFSEIALDTYHNKHNILDETIKNTVAITTEGESI